MLIRILTAFLGLLLVGCERKPSEPTATRQDQPAAAPTDTFLDSLLREMTLEEKIGQLTLYTSDLDETGPSVRPGYEADIRQGRVGAIFNAYGVEYTRRLQRMAVEESRLGIPLLFGYDVIHGHRTIFPIPLGEAASWDLAAIEQSARIAAVEATAEGLHWTFAPMVDVARDPRWGRVAEGAGEDTYFGTQVGLARLRGFQGPTNDLGATNTLLACAKHFAAYGLAQAGRDYHTVDLSDRVLREVYLPPFEALARAGVGSFMTSFNELDGVPATGSKYLMMDILRGEWNYQGFVVTDYTAINEMIPHGVAADSSAAGALALQAGVDMDMQGGIYQEHLAALVQAGRVAEAQIDEAARRVLRAKKDLGLFEDPYRYCSPERERSQLMTEAHLSAARDVARKSVVLLKNENQTLPLSPNVRTLAVIGPLADSQRDMLGSWSAAGQWENCVTLLTGIRERVGDQTRILTAPGVDVLDTNTGGIGQAVALARQADVVVVAVGEKALMSGEAASRTDIGLPGRQQQLVEALHATGKPVVVVLMNGRPLAIPWLQAHVPAILETWFLGTQAGHAIADVLFGDYNPSGKLPMTFPRSVGQIPIHYNMKNTGRPLDEQNKYTSKYLDSPNTPLYPFGYGLSYTTFAYENLRVSNSRLRVGDSLTVSVTLRNAGQRAGEEVVQLYTRQPVASVTRPVRELRGFQKIRLEPGEQHQVEFRLSAAELAFFRQDMRFGSEPGLIQVFVGTNSAEGLETSFELYSDGTP